VFHPPELPRNIRGLNACLRRFYLSVIECRSTPPSKLAPAEPISSWPPAAQKEALTGALRMLLTIRRTVPWTLHVPISLMTCWKE
jgi:hypothetical protein